MRLIIAKKRVFRKFGENLSVKKENRNYVFHVTPSYARPKIILIVINFQDNFILKLTY